MMVSLQVALSRSHHGWILSRISASVAGCSDGIPVTSLAGRRDASRVLDVTVAPAITSDRVSDADLMARLSAGDQAALGDMHDRYAGLVYAACLRILRDPTAAEEAMSDAFIDLWRRASTWDERRGSLATWLLVLARSRSIDRLRRRDLSSVGDAAEEQIETDPGAPLVQDEERRAVLQLMATLVPEQRRSLELAYWGGLSQSEIATQLERPLGTIKTWIRDGLMQLRELWTQQHGGGV